MTRPEEIAAALERWDRVRRGYHTVNGYPEWSTAGDDLALLLHAANPPNLLESSPEPFNWWCPTCQIGVPPLHVTYQERHDPRVGGCGQVVQSKPEPATPAVGEDNAALLGGLDMLAHYQCDPGVTCGIAAKARDKISALLADVARERERADTNLANAKEVQQKWCDESNLALRLETERDEARAEVARLQEAQTVLDAWHAVFGTTQLTHAQARLEKAEADVARERDWRVQAEAERDRALLRDDDALAEARATLAAVRKVAENYHDVDAAGDPPREVACNPCANEILGVLEGRERA